MIYGSGIDLVSIERIKKIYHQFPDKFVKKIFTNQEIATFRQNNHYKAESFTNFLAKRFAAKEATAKAFGTGIGNYFSFLDFEILKNQFSKPMLVVNHRKLTNFLKQEPEIAKLSLSPSNFRFHVSISDETKGKDAFAIAIVIIEII